MATPTNKHLAAAKHVLRYLKHTAHYGLLFTGSGGTTGVPTPTDVIGTTTISVYTDASWASDTKERKSTSGVVVLVNGTPISWLSKKQSAIALSSCESEYIAAASGVSELK